MAVNGLSDSDLNKLKAGAKFIEESSKDLESYLKALNEVKSLEKNISQIKSEQQKIGDKISEINAKILTTQGAAQRKLIDELAINKQLLVTTTAILDNVEEEVKYRIEALNTVKQHVVVLKSMWVQADKMGKSLLKQTGYFLSQEKSVKETELSMGILSSQAGAFRKNIYKTAISTSQIGVTSKELAKIQGTYSEEIGRSVQLSESQLNAISEIGKGTTLGVEGAARFAGNMERFGISAEGSADLVSEMLNTAHKMGVNSSKVIKSVEKNMRLANKYHFKGGVKGLTEMAALTTKFKLEMESVAGFAEKLITPEGAVEAAAKLQVLGGEWSKLGDPFELMFRARNDMTGLTKDIIEATKATARFDKETGEMTIDPMELHRLREVASATGISFDELAQSAKEAAKFSKIEAQISGRFNKEDKEYISSLAQFDKKSGKFKFTYQNEVGKTVTESVDSLISLDSSKLKLIKNEKESLKDRAKQAMTFDESFNGLVNSFKSGILPGFEIIATSLEGFIHDLEPVIKDLGEWMAGNSGYVAAIGTALVGLKVIGDLTMWVARGVSLGKGFTMSAKLGGGSLGAPNPPFVGPMNQPMTRMGKMGKTLGAKSTLGGGVLSGALAGYGEWSANSETDMSTTENTLRTVSTGGGAMAGTMGGAALGSLAGPIGTVVGGIVGGILGGIGGDKLGDAFGNEKYNDFISRPGSNPISFSSSDTLIGAKSGGPIDKLLDNSSGVKASVGKMVVDFSKPLAIEGKIELKLGETSAKIDLNDPILMRELSRVIQEQLSSAISGGKTSSNPVS